MLQNSSKACKWVNFAVTRDMPAMRQVVDSVSSWIQTLLRTNSVKAYNSTTMWMVTCELSVEDSLLFSFSSREWEESEDAPRQLLLGGSRTGSGRHTDGFGLLGNACVTAD